MFLTKIFKKPYLLSLAFIYSSILFLLFIGNSFAGGFDTHSHQEMELCLTLHIAPFLFPYIFIF